MVHIKSSAADTKNRPGYPGGFLYLNQSILFGHPENVFQGAGRYAVEQRILLVIENEQGRCQRIDDTIGMVAERIGVGEAGGGSDCIGAAHGGVGL